MDIEKEIFGAEAAVDDALPAEFETMTAEGISQRARLLENELRVLRDESTRLTLETNNLKERIKENKAREKKDKRAGNRVEWRVGSCMRRRRSNDPQRRACMRLERRGKGIVYMCGPKQDQPPRVVSDLSISRLGLACRDRIKKKERTDLPDRTSLQGGGPSFCHSRC